MCATNRLVFGSSKNYSKRIHSVGARIAGWSREFFYWKLLLVACFRFQWNSMVDAPVNSFSRCLLSPPSANWNSFFFLWVGPLKNLEEFKSFSALQTFEFFENHVAFYFEFLVRFPQVQTKPLFLIFIICFWWESVQSKRYFHLGFFLWSCRIERLCCKILIWFGAPNSEISLKKNLVPYVLQFIPRKIMCKDCAFT